MSFFSELKRRNVFRVGIAYAIVAWLILQVLDVVLPILLLPDWVAKVILLVLITGLPLALVFAWAYELTPEGVKREVEVDRTKSITSQTGRKLDFAIIAVLAFAVIFFALDKFLWANLETPSSGKTDDRRSIAVLPFVNMSGDPEQTYFSDGISEEILNALVRVGGISVASRTSSFTYRGELQSIPEIAAELGVLYVLEGSVRKAGEQVRITAQLIEADTDRHLWSNTYDRHLADIFFIQSEIANAITAALKDALGVEDIAPVPVRQLTENMDAYDLYLKGYGLFLGRTETNHVRDSIEHLEEAVRLDPNFAIGWEALAAAYSVASAWLVEEFSYAEYMRLSGEAVDRALSLDPDLAFAYAIKGSNAGSDMIEGLRLYEIAMQRDPLNATTHHWYGTHFLFLGLLETSMAAQERCLEIDPAYLNCLYYLTIIQHSLGLHENAMNTMNRRMENVSPFFIAIDVPMLLLGGNRMAAIFAAHGIDGFWGAPIIEWIRAMENPEEDHSRGLAKWDAWADENGIELGKFPEVLAAFHAYDRLLNDATEEPWYWLPTYAHYRHSPEFKFVIREYGILEFWREKGFPPQCRPIGTEDFECD
jgi:TolB-like protein